MPSHQSSLPTGPSAHQSRCSPYVLPRRRRRLTRLGVLLVLVMGAALGMVLAGRAWADTELGGVDLNRWCQHLGWQEARLHGPAQGPNAAYNWRCATGSSESSIDVQGACRWQYSQPNATAHPTNVNDAYSWRCYAPDSPPSGGGTTTTGAPSGGPSGGGAYGAYEPNNTAAEAYGPLTGGTTYNATIETPDDKDFYYFYVAGEHQMDVTVSSTTADGYCGIQAEIDDEQGNTPAHFIILYRNQSDHLRWTTPAGTTKYYLVITDYGAPTGTCAYGTANTYSFQVNPAAALTTSLPPPPAAAPTTPTTSPPTSPRPHRRARSRCRHGRHHHRSGCRHHRRHR